MKHFLKTWLPILLILALLVGAAWYFLYERTDLTVDALIYWADRFTAKQRYNRAIVCYRWAWKLDAANENIPLWLAETYQLDGNHTKAEYTLVSGITQNPDSIHLYCALCRLYVAQNKLLDAEDMLERISNDTVLEQIDELRPSDPVISPESGYYDDYLDVSISSPSTVYYCLNGDFPANDDDIYTQPIHLDGGESKIVAISVGSNGLVSHAAYAGYTIGNVLEEVEITDPVLNAAVRELLGKTLYDTIMSDELWELEALEIPEGVESLEDLKLFTGLTSLSVHETAIHDFSPLSYLTLLHELDLSGCTISTDALQSVASLPELARLNISNCAIADITPLTGLSKLNALDLSYNSVNDITPVSAMTSLKELYLMNNPVASIGAVSSLDSLEILDCSSCSISRITPVSDLKTLREFHASNNSVKDLSPLKLCEALSVLDFSNNQIEDISVLSHLPQLSSVLLSNNRIKTLPDFDPDLPLWNLQIDHNEIEALEPLAGITSLNFVNLDYNKITSVACMDSCSTLVQLDVWDNPIVIDEAKKLQEMGIIVNYNPNYTPPEEPEETE